jgi:hypothetical protein
LALAYSLQPLARHSAGLLIPLLLIDQMLRDNPGCQERQQPLPKTMQLQDVTSAAYDMHTSEDSGAVAGSSSSEFVRSLYVPGAVRCGPSGNRELRPSPGKAPGAHSPADRAY